MRRIRTASLKASAALLTLGLVGGLALLVHSVPGRADESQTKGYLPGLGDLMNDSMQVHHLKLWFAGHADNWALAAYELKEIRETVEDIGKFSPDWNSIPVGAMVKSLDPKLKVLDEAIKAKDPVKFDVGYHELTLACNACHTAAGQPEIVITEPPPQGGGPFGDQIFTKGTGPQ